MELDDDALRLLAEEARSAALAAGVQGDHPGVTAYMDELVTKAFAHAEQAAAVRVMDHHAQHVVMEARRSRADHAHFR